MAPWGSRIDLNTMSRASSPQGAPEDDEEELPPESRTHGRTEAETAITHTHKAVSAAANANPTLAGLRDKLEELIEEYNAGAKSVGDLYANLAKFADELEKQEERAKAEGLTAEEMAFFDVMLAAGGAVDTDGREALRNAARTLVTTLPSKLVIEWRKSEKKRAGVNMLIETVLENTPYADDAYRRACDEVSKHVYESYFGEGRSKFSVN